MQFRCRNLFVLLQVSMIILGVNELVKNHSIVFDGNILRHIFHQTTFDETARHKSRSNGIWKARKRILYGVLDENRQLSGCVCYGTQHNIRKTDFRYLSENCRTAFDNIGYDCVLSGSMVYAK